MPDLIKQLFDWLKEIEAPSLVKSCIFHYKFEFIHPFADGNGRTRRLWHTLILAKWQEFYLWIPVRPSSMRQQKYYNALNASNNAGGQQFFVQFMLELIRDILRRTGRRQSFNSEKSTEDKVIALIKRDGSLSAAKIAEKLGLSERQIQRVLKAA